MKQIRKVFKTDKFSLHECKDGYWLYDYVLGMNLSIRAKTEQDAFIEALNCYQKRLQEVQTDYKELNTKVEDFLAKFQKEEDY